MPRLQQCPCGSKEFPEAQHDGHGIFLCYTCSKCERRKMATYRPDIHTRYEADEPIDGD